MKIQVKYGINGSREYTDIYEAYIRVKNLRRDKIPTIVHVQGSHLETTAWKEMFINEPDENT